MNVHIDCQDYAEELQDELKAGTKYNCADGVLSTKDYTFTFSDEFKSLYDKYSQFCNPLIYGKNTMLGIVAVELSEDQSQLSVFFFDGSVKTFPYRPWILTPQKEDTSSERLEGFLHYKYLKFIKPDENTWRIKDKFQIWNGREAALTLHGLTLFKGLNPSQLGVLSFDIESAGLAHDNESDVYIITCAFQKNETVLKKHFRQDEYENTGAMIEAWCEWVQMVNPDVLVGHNIYGYDLPYLSFVAEKFGKTLNLGRDGSAITYNSKPSEYRVDGNTSWSYKKSHIYGRQIIDGMFLAVKYDFGRKYPSWGLKPIVEAEGMQKEGRVFYDASKIRQNWSNPVEREKIVAYAVDDSEDSLNLYNLMIPAYFYMCQSLPIPFEEMMQGATGKWMNSIVVRSYLQDKRSIPKADERTTVYGGISFGNPRLYKNVYKVDVTSLYPSCILTYGIYPEKKDPDQNFLKMVRFFTEERIANKVRFKQTKDKNYDDLQAAQKIAINSSYGMLGTSGLQFNDFGAANQVTLRGRSVLRHAIVWASGKDVGDWFEGYDYEKDQGVTIETPISHNFIIGPTDTDSISFTKHDMSAFSDLEQSQLLDELNSIMDKGITFEDDGYFTQILAVAAKNYCLVESGSTKVKMKGSSIKDAKKEPILRDFMNDVIDSLIYERNTVHEIYEHYCVKARNIKDITPWAVKKSISKKLLTSDRKQERDVVTALGDASQYREGDKVFIYTTAPKFVPEFDEAGEPVLYKSGKNKGQQKGKWEKVVKLTSNYENDADVEHYLGRVYATLSIFENVLDMSQFTCYSE
jgi:DNA polymerase elongation subunit (family B)